MLKFLLIIILILILILILIYILISHNKNKNKYNSKTKYKKHNFKQKNFKVISNLENKAGFFSTLFFTINHYIYSKKYKLPFEIYTNNWTYKYKDGWSDYFKNLIVNENYNYKNQKIFEHNDILDENTTLDEYKNAIKNIYVYNEKTLNYIKNIKKKLKLVNNNYDSIYIRRGDKLFDESIIIPAYKYLDVLLLKNKNCKIIYLQTDDYSSYLELKDYIKKKKLNIKVITLCNPNSRGCINNEYYKNILLNTNAEHIKDNTNAEHIKNNISYIKKQKTLKEMNNNEIYDHTINLICGIDIIVNSNICVLDFQSNVSRFIKLFHENSKNVIDVKNPDLDWNYNKNIHPAYYDEEYY
jgi:preprotein translocase subunit SecG